MTDARPPRRRQRPEAGFTSPTVAIGDQPRRKFSKASALFGARLICASSKTAAPISLSSRRPAARSRPRRRRFLSSCVTVAR